MPVGPSVGSMAGVASLGRDDFMLSPPPTHGRWLADLIKLKAHSYCCSFARGNLQSRSDLGGGEVDCSEERVRGAVEMVKWPPAQCFWDETHAEDAYGFAGVSV